MPTTTAPTPMTQDQAAAHAIELFGPTAHTCYSRRLGQEIWSEPRESFDLFIDSGDDTTCIAVSHVSWEDAFEEARLTPTERSVKILTGGVL